MKCEASFVPRDVDSRWLSRIRFGTSGSHRVCPVAPRRHMTAHVPGAVLELKLRSLPSIGWVVHASARFACWKLERPCPRWMGERGAEKPPPSPWNVHVQSACVCERRDWQAAAAGDTPVVRHDAGHSFFFFDDVH